MEKIRLDNLLVEQGLVPSREKARSLILAGEVMLQGRRLDKPGMFIDAQSRVDIRQKMPYVSRGGLKLEKALTFFDLDLTGKTIIDIGASTGGFTDCALQRGAAKVYAVDVGYGQLDWTLRNDPRVINLEKTNIREVDPLLWPELADLIMIDVSFISTRLVFPVAKMLLRQGGQIIALIKPQFEAGRKQVGRKGVVRDKTVHIQVLLNCIGYLRENDLYAHCATYSPLTGPQGNIEFFILADQEKTEPQINDKAAAVTVEAAHHQLKP